MSDLAEQIELYADETLDDARVVHDEDDDPESLAGAELDEAID